MPANQFLPFGVGPGDDATPQGEYAAATWRVQGWRSGILPHEQINKVLRQTSSVASALAQVIADFTQVDVVDDGNLTQLTNQLKTLLSSYLPYNPTVTYPPGSIGWAIQNGLGTGGTMTGAQIRAALTGSLTAAEFSSIINGRLNLIDAPTTGLVTRVNDLTTAYGTTVSAASSAAAANASAIAAAASQAAANVSAGAALSSQNSASTSATTATTAAGNASTSASAAANSATSAAGSATSASTSASTAVTARNAAQTAATAASTSATSASAAATDAIEAAESAQASATSAGTSAASASTASTTATGAATTATGAASTATTQANLAATSASNAAASATAAATSATTATSAATAAGNSASTATTAANTANTRAADATSAATAAANSASTASSASTSAGSAATAANASAVSASASASTATSGANNATTAANNAATSASAAATSASNAAASATAAQTSATASQSSRLAAETAQAGASTAASQAVSARNAAQTAQAAAQSSATTAATAVTSAGASATAANTSAAQAAASASDAEGSAEAAADWYNQTVSATGGLSAQVVQEANTRASQIAGVHAQLVFKTVATRPDGKRVLGAIGLASTAPNDATGGQSEILMQADRLVFVPSSDPNADPKQAFVVGSVNGVTTIVVNQAVIGDTTILPRHINTPSLSALAANLGVVTAGLIRNGSDTFNVDVTNGRTIARTGAFMKVTGIPFGSSNQFIEWFGPYFPSLSSCTEANAVQYLKTNGSAYFGGTLSAGILRNSIQTTDQASNASVVLGPFGTNGGAKTYVLSYVYTFGYVIIDNVSFSGSGGATVVLEKWNGSAWVALTTLNANAVVTIQNPGSGPLEPGFLAQEISGSTTFVDNAAGAAPVQLRARLTSRTLINFTSTGNGSPASISQNIAIVSTE